ncbi:PH domain-containing protein, partial [Candidatus Woesearchaeota archaeon]|nr:PH domain-containing protein [Candidatus Woesearchaeota archaeon]
LTLFIPWMKLVILSLAALFLIGLIVSIKVRSYHIQNYRVIAKWGVFYKSQKSIVYDKIDHLNQTRGVLHKMFNNGSITIHTVGDTMSGRAEMQIDNIKAYKEFYERLKQQYES